jgi:hypothetical protein
MSHTTDSGAINSGAINHTSFPGSENGLSLAQMVGSVSVTGTVTGIFVRLTAFATTAPRAATAKPVARLKRTLAAATSGTATATATQLGKIRRSASASARAVSASGVGRRVRLAMTRVASAVVTAKPVLRLRILRSAVAKPTAAATLSSRKKVFLDPVDLVARARVAVNALRKVRSPAATVGDVNFSVLIALKRRLTITPVVARALNAATQTTRKMRLAAALIAQANSAVVALIKVLRRAVVAPQAACSPLASGARVFRQAPIQAQAISVSAAALRISVNAATVASFANYAVAIDLNINQRAAEERRMTVPLDERRMEVTA